VTGFAESHVEEAGIECLKELGWFYLDPQAIAPDGPSPQRPSFGDAILTRRFEAAIQKLNPHIPDDALASSARQVLNTDKPNLTEENRRLHRLMTEGVGVEYRAPDGTIQSDRVWLIDFQNPLNNDWVVTNQFTVAEKKTHRPDVVCFLNGLPVAVLELKNAASENATVHDAYNQLQTYKTNIPSLFRTNAVLVASDGMQARVASLTANEERYMPWRTVDGDDFAPRGTPEQDTLLAGVFNKRVFLDLISEFTVFGDKGDGLFKVVAGYHQYHGAKKAVAEAIDATRPGGDRKIGVIWHTQGSGKSFLMAFFAGLAVKSQELENPTILVLTDRNELDDQLHGTFDFCHEVLRQRPRQAESREALKELLDTSAGGVIFSTVQKFSPEKGEEAFPLLSERSNVIIMADEAHRSQYGLSAKIDTKSGTKRYGYAHYIRQALPNASFIGFTGTPIENGDVSTPAIFGRYIDVYDISRAVEDGATVPIYYESRLARIELDDEMKPLIDAEIEAMTEDDELSVAEQNKAKWASIEALVGSEKRLKQVARDMVEHLENRLEAQEGKAMAVCMSRKICVALYDEIIKLRPDWHSDDDNAGAIKVVMSGSASDPQEFQPHIRSKRQRQDMAKRAAKVSDPLKLVIVRDMWLTGFDAPCMNTMYVDKPMRGHGLMQAIARVNRVFRDKEGGLIVDYIGIAQNLKSALAHYSPRDQEQTGIDQEAAVAALQEAYEQVAEVFHGFDYSKGLTGEPREKLATLGLAMDWVLQWQERLAGEKTREEEKKKAHNAYSGLALNLAKAFKLAAGTPEAAELREEVGFFDAVRAILNKRTGKGKASSSARAFAVQQLVDKAVVSSEIVDVLQATGIKSPDISVLSDEFLAEMKSLKQKNLALEALKKLLNGEISARSRSNTVEARAFSQRLDEAVARYHANAITALEMIQELINMAKDLKASIARGEDTGLSPEEVAFYDALALNDSAVEALGNDQLRVIAHELLEALQKNVTVDWHRKESARARMRVLVKRILKRYGYPPDLSEKAVQDVLAQAEILLRYDMRSPA
tara:strand:- start:1837 stop:4983 length:3147 start_codon:yes stop_codon:yes gene_type:complete